MSCHQEASHNGAKLVVLPEMWNCPYSNDSFPTYAEDIDSGPSPSTQMLSEVQAQQFLPVAPLPSADCLHMQRGGAAAGGRLLHAVVLVWLHFSR